MEERAGTDRPARTITHLTVRDIRGLLTRIGNELVRTLATEPPANDLPQEARPIDPRRFVESMRPFVRMN